ncbi:hypothetical protein RhiJN_26294 [Ceratobasidium sp. AG-Ba]|nr:hypothetical protein RhiJN_26294 [Ceratobasidium sp. AG-Ba]
MSAESDLEFINAGLKARMVDRQKAIDSGNTRAEREADKKIYEGLQQAAQACPPRATRAKQVFQHTANEYGASTDRNQRDNIIGRILYTIIAKKTAAAILLGAGTLAIGAFAAPALVVDPNTGQPVAGAQIDNEDGTHQVLYDSNGNGFYDHQVTVNDTTGYTTDPDSLGFMDVARDFLEMLF